ncbi:thioredoxin [Patescibacteria group bacterium]|nr:thioredoxin [Patescibacteria group bacterium]
MFSMVKLIDFFATWCGPCRAMLPIVEETVSELQGKIEFEKVDVDSNSPRAQEFGVMSIPTFVLLKDGKEVDRKMGMISKEQFAGWIKLHI